MAIFAPSERTSARRDITWLADSIRTPSVTSSCRRLGARLLCLSASRTWLPKRLWRNCKGDTFTETDQGLGQRAAVLQAVSRAQRPRGIRAPLDSAMGMNWAGEIGPRTGWFQRSRASKPLKVRVDVLKMGWY